MKNSVQQDIDLITNGVQYLLWHQYVISYLFCLFIQWYIFQPRKIYSYSVSECFGMLQSNVK